MLFRKTLSLLVLLAACQTPAQQKDSCTLGWTTPQQVSLDTVDVVLTRVLRNGSLLFVMWQQYPESGIACSRSIDDGVTWSEPQVVIPPTNGNIPVAISAVAEGFWIYLSWDGCDPCSPNPVSHVRFQRSSDFGQSWSPTQNLSIGSHGKLAALDTRVFLNFQDSVFQSSFLQSTDNGETFSRLPGTPPLLGGYLFDAFVASPSGLHGLSQRPPAPSGVAETRYYRSTDFGLTWEDSRFLSTLDTFGSRVSGMAAMGDTLYAVWIDGKYGGFLFTGTVLSRCSLDGGNTFQPERILSANTAFRYSVAAADNVVGAVWDSDEDGSFRFSHVYYAMSRDHGETFCPPGRVENSFFATQWPDIAIGTRLFVSAARRNNDSTGSRSVFVTLSDPLTDVGGQGLPDPGGFILLDPYPNPFNSGVIVRYSIPTSEPVTLEIYNPLGQKVWTSDGKRVSPGTHSFTWDGRDISGRTVSSGVYVIRVRAGARFQHKRVIYLK